MRNLSVLCAALEQIEERLKAPLSVKDLAASCYSSYSGLQKLFGYAFHCSVNVYVTKRRISCASRDLVNGDFGIADIAFEYQYGSPEAFSRAFKRVWGISPAEFRKTRRFTELQPKLKIENENGGYEMKERRPVDISELYDEFKKLGGSYLLSLDLIHFQGLNEAYGYAAGDIAIAEVFARLEKEIGGEMLLFRIGGDEFAVITGYRALPEAEELAQRITAHNGEAIKFGGNEIPVSLRVGISRLPEGTLNYREALDLMYGSIETARKARDHIGIV